jgi:hypothetical protein
MLAHSFIKLIKSLLISVSIVSGKVLDWVKDYISNRQQVVFINNETSNYSDIKAYTT